MGDYGSLCHTKWECKYHVVFIPKCRRKTLYGQLRRHLGEVFRELAGREESRKVEPGAGPVPESCRTRNSGMAVVKKRTDSSTSVTEMLVCST